ncbi:MAG: hypothetical protein ACI4A5_02270 [Hominilimicola sp.]
MADERKCCWCVYAEYDSSANNKWYCTYHKKHMRADEHCWMYKLK